MPEYLITGGLGRLGSELCGKLSAVAPASTELDILDEKQIADCLRACPVNAILHLAAIADSAACERDKPRSYLVNVMGTANMARAAKQFQKKLVYISTDYVFPGTRGEYAESDAPSPANWYGFTKYAGELEIQNRTENHLIIRTAFRPSLWPFKSAYDNVLSSADYVDVIGREILLALSLNLTGLVHIGTAPKTLFELARLRNPDIVPESAPAHFPKRKDFSLKRWEEIKKQARAAA
ncbi:MAG: sugar nucleotide-binding protein [Patescibacteria group bacterium]